MRLLYVVKVVVLFEDLPLDLTAPTPTKADVSSQDWEASPIIAVCAGAWYNFAGMFLVTAAEVYSVYIAQHAWGWSITASALFLAVVMLTSGVFNVLLGRLAGKVTKEHAGLVAVSLLACITCVPLFQFNYHNKVWNQAGMLYTGIVLMIAATSCIRAWGFSIPSKLAPAHSKQRITQMLTMSQNVGRSVGGIVGATLNEESFGPVTLGIVALSVIASIMTYKSMKRD